MSATVETGGGGDEPEFDADRQLCDDGNCLGVVVDGKCNVCGLAAAATSPRDGGSGQTGGNAATSPRDNGSGQTASAATSPRDNGSGQTGGLATQGAGDDEAFDGEERRLCPDGACTGLIGADSKCKVCGRTYSDSAS